MKSIVAISLTCLVVLSAQALTCPAESSANFTVVQDPSAPDTHHFKNDKAPGNWLSEQGWNLPVAKNLSVADVKFVKAVGAASDHSLSYCEYTITIKFRDGKNQPYSEQTYPKVFMHPFSATYSIDNDNNRWKKYDDGGGLRCVTSDITQCHFV